MTDPNYTAMLVVIDRSGSMSNIRDEMVTAVRGLLDDQAAEPGKLTVDIYSFDDVVTREFHLANPLDVVVSLEPRNFTALYDAIGIAVTEFGETLAAMPESERPDTVQVIVVTDGMENASREWHLSRVRELVLRQKESHKWDFVFLGANQDAVMTGEGLGFDRGSSMSFDPSAGGVDAMLKASSRYTSDLRRKQKRVFMMEERMASLEAENDALRRAAAEAQARAAEDSTGQDETDSKSA
jgi:hypothetical protein